MSTTIAALPFMGGTLSGFDPLDTSCFEDASHGGFDASWATCALSVGPSSTATSPLWPVAADFWGRAFVQLGTPVDNFGTLPIIRFLHTGTVVALISATHVNSFTYTYNVQTLQSGVLTTVGSFTRSGTLNPLDLHVVGNTASGSATLYSNNTVAIPTVGGLNHSAWAGVDQIVLVGTSVDIAGNSLYSEIIADTTSTVGRRVKYATMNTASATNTGWTGAPSDIDEIPTNDATFISAASAALVSTYFQTGLSLGTDNILAVGASARMKREDASGPQNIQLAVRSGGANHFSATVAAGLGFQAAFNSWTTDPTTGIAWTDAGAASSEEGVKSIA